MKYPVKTIARKISLIAAGLALASSLSACGAMSRQGDMVADVYDNVYFADNAYSTQHASATQVAYMPKLATR
jgi:hypothetical protein